MRKIIDNKEIKDELVQKAVEYNDIQSNSYEIKEKIISLAVRTTLLLKDEISIESELQWLLEENISNWIWKITESPGPKRETKYKGQRYWSGASLDHYQRTRSTKGLRHEHVFERKKLIDEIVEAHADEEQIKKIFKKAVACVVLHDEHKKLKSGNGWQRYKSAKVEKVDLLEESIIEENK